MQFVTIDPRNATVEIVQAKEVTEVYERVGLERGKVDFATIHRYEDNGYTINIVVFEYGLFLPSDQGKYFSLGSHLYEGGAVIFAADAIGNTIDIRAKPPVMFYRDGAEVENAIAAGVLQRPTIAINEKEIWSWPAKR